MFTRIVSRIVLVGIGSLLRRLLEVRDKKVIDGPCEWEGWSFGIGMAPYLDGEFIHSSLVEVPSFT